MDAHPNPLTAVVDALDDVYRVDEPAEWLGRLVDRLVEVTGIEEQLAFLFAPWSPTPAEPAGPPLGVATRGEISGRIASATTAMATSPDPRFASFKHVLAQAFTGRPAFGRDKAGDDQFWATSPLATMLEQLGVHDQACLATTSGDSPALLTIGLPHGPLGSAGHAVRQLEALAPHAGAASRLVRRQLAPDPPRTEARLAPDGRVLDATAAAKPRSVRERLRAAVEQVERSRGPLRRRDPEEALSLRVALVAGRWSLLDHWDSDGRRYWLAVENSHAVPSSPGRLTPRQRLIVHLLARGLEPAEIADELGLSAATISTHIAAACRRLGVHGRGGLVGALARPQLFLPPDDRTG